MRNPQGAVAAVVLCAVAQLVRGGDVGPGGLAGPGGGLGDGGLVGDGGGLGFGGAASLGLASPNAPLAVPLAASVSFVRQPFVRIGFVARPVVTYVNHAVATVSHTIRPVVTMGNPLGGAGVPLDGAGFGGVKGPKAPPYGLS